MSRTNNILAKVSEIFFKTEIKLKLFTWYNRNHLNNHLLLSAHRLCKTPASLESYRAFSAKPKSWPSFILMDLCMRCTLGLNIRADIFPRLCYAFFLVHNSTGAHRNWRPLCEAGKVDLGEVHGCQTVLYLERGRLSLEAPSSTFSLSVSAAVRLFLLPCVAYCSCFSGLVSCVYISTS